MNQKELQAELGNRLFQIRKWRGYSQLDVAKRMRLSRTSITNIECGRQALTVWRLAQYCKAIGVEPCQILSESWENLRHADQ